MSADLRPRAPQGPSDAELNYVPPDPVLAPFSFGCNELYGQAVGEPAPINALFLGSRADHLRRQIVVRK
jgi:hypothetical protein